MLATRFRSFGVKAYVAMLSSVLEATLGLQGTGRQNKGEYHRLQWSK